MNTTSIQTIIKICSKLDKKGYYSKADNLFEKVAQYYPQQSITQSPNVSLVPYEDIEEETKQNDFWRQKINPRKIPKEYFDLGGEADGQSIEGQLGIKNSDIHIRHQHSGKICRWGVHIEHNGQRH